MVDTQLYPDIPRHMITREMLWAEVERLIEHCADKDRTIERLTAELASSQKFVQRNADAVDALQAERDRLRAALEKIVSDETRDGCPYSGPACTAREALDL